MNGMKFILCCTLCLLAAVYGCSSSTGDRKGVEPPETPTGLSIESFNDGTVQLSWSVVDHEELKGYNIYWNAGSQVDSLTEESLFIEPESAEITGLICGTTYYFAVAAVDNSDNESPLSIQVSGMCEVITDLSPPPRPSGLEITSIGNGSASLRWSEVEVSDLKGYTFYWQSGAHADTLSENSTFLNDTTITIINLEYETLYFFAVSAVDLSGNESVLSVQAYGKPLNTTSPSPPSNVDIAAENLDIPIINVYWEQNPEPDISHYNVYRALNTVDLDDSTASFVTSLTQEYYKDTDVDIGSIYYYKITAVDKENWESSASPIVNDRLLPSVELISPINFQSTTNIPTFRWKPVDGAEKYVLTLMQSRIGGEIWYITVNKNSTEMPYSGTSNLISGNSYFWRVGAITRSEINSESEVGSFVVKTE